VKRAEPNMLRIVVTLQFLCDGNQFFRERYLNHILSATVDCGKLGA